MLKIKPSSGFGYWKTSVSTSWLCSELDLAASCTTSPCLWGFSYNCTSISVLRLYIYSEKMLLLASTCKAFEYQESNPWCLIHGHTHIYPPSPPPTSPHPSQHGMFLFNIFILHKSGTARAWTNRDLSRSWVNGPVASIWAIKSLAGLNSGRVLAQQSHSHCC